MTANLVHYWQHKEQARHNVVTEEQTASYNAEVKRHNLESELISHRQIDLGYDQLAETTRHNQVSESNQLLQIQESIRHNKASERLQSQSIAETVRHNSEMETLESREVFTKQRGQDLKEQQFELSKTQYVTDTYLESAGLLTKAASTIAQLFGKKGK
nr:MAG: hypothetical protein [Picobirnavirus sp.]